VTANRDLLPELPRLFDLLGGDPWTVYRFLIQHHPELEGKYRTTALQRGEISPSPGDSREYRRRILHGRLLQRFALSLEIEANLLVTVVSVARFNDCLG
jgi:hypothetical protein